jgi:hypothetical protein
MKEVQKLQDHLYLLRDIRERGSTLMAIREGYVNLYGGFALTLPPWLEDLVNLLNIYRSSENAPERVDLLRTAILRASQEKDMEQEIVAELDRLLWHALYDTFGLSDVQVQEEQKTCLEMALQVYTFIHYPYQYARMQGNLGNAYRRWQGKDQISYRLCNTAEQPGHILQPTASGGETSEFGRSDCSSPVYLAHLYSGCISARTCPNSIQPWSYLSGADRWGAARESGDSYFLL